MHNCFLQSELPLDKLQVIHRYRPQSTNIPPIVENGHVQNYTCHVGSALHAKNYVDFYMKEGEDFLCFFFLLKAQC